MRVHFLSLFLNCGTSRRRRFKEHRKSAVSQGVVSIRGLLVTDINSQVSSFMHHYVILDIIWLHLSYKKIATLTKIIRQS